MKFHNSHIIPNLQNIACPKELVPHCHSLSNAWLHSSTASLSKVVVFDEISSTIAFFWPKILSLPNLNQSR